MTPTVVSDSISRYRRLVVRSATSNILAILAPFISIDTAFLGCARFRPVPTHVSCSTPTLANFVAPMMQLILAELLSLNCVWVVCGLVRVWQERVNQKAKVADR